MPISVGRRGVPAVLSNPAMDRRLGRSTNLGGGYYPGGNLAFRSPSLNATSLYISGITKDSTGAPLGGCAVKLFRSTDDIMILSTVSDATGNYSFPVLVGGPFYVVAYKAGSPDVAGATRNDLVGV